MGSARSGRLFVGVSTSGVWPSGSIQWHGQAANAAQERSTAPSRRSRKMCVVVQHDLAKGWRAAPCWIPPAQRLAVASPVRAFAPRHPDQPPRGWIATEERSVLPGPHRARGEMSLSPLHPPSTNPARIRSALNGAEVGSSPRLPLGVQSLLLWKSTLSSRSVLV